MNGFRSRTPSIMECDTGELRVCEWVHQMEERLQCLTDSAALGSAKAVAQRKARYDEGARLREFPVGSKVFYRTPGLCNKLAESWEVPFIVEQKVGKN